MLATFARRLALALVPLSLLAGTTPHAFAQAGAPQQAAPQMAGPDHNKLAILIHTSLIALNQANLTGNYSVLRDLGAPGFQSVNSPAKLADIFAPLRRKGVDISPIVLFTPKLVRHPVVDQRGLLTLSGFFDTKPQRVEFDLLFQAVGGDWRLFGIRADVVPGPTPVAGAAAPTQQAAAPAPQAAPKTAAAPRKK
jgi:hypothetical protein